MFEFMMTTVEAFFPGPGRLIDENTFLNDFRSQFFSHIDFYIVRNSTMSVTTMETIVKIPTQRLRALRSLRQYRL